MPLLREPGSVMVTPNVAWSIQAGLKFNSMMLSQVTHRPVFPPETVPTLRDKVNRLILRFADEPGITLLGMPVTFDEAWTLDWLFNAQSFTGAEAFLCDVFRCLWELANDLTLNEQSAKADPPWREVEEAYTRALAGLDGEPASEDDAVS